MLITFSIKKICATANGEVKVELYLPIMYMHIHFFYKSLTILYINGPVDEGLHLFSDDVLKFI